MADENYKFTDDFRIMFVSAILPACRFEIQTNQVLECHLDSFFLSNFSLLKWKISWLTMYKIHVHNVWHWRKDLEYWKRLKCAVLGVNVKRLWLSR